MSTRKKPNPDTSPVCTQPSHTVSDAIKTRRSIREFHRDQPVPIELMRKIVGLSSRAASGGNIQPWNVYVVSGAARDALCNNVLTKIKAEMAASEPELEYDIYPLDMKHWKGDAARYMANRRELGYEMYSLMGIERKDQQKRFEAMMRNFDFFGAPVGVIVTIHKGMGPPQWCDLGCFITNFMLLCREEGLHTCPQEAWATFPKTVKASLNIPEDETLFCGIAVGHADTSVPVNTLQSKRSAMTHWAKFIGFGETPQSKL